MKKTKHIRTQPELAQFVINLSKWDFVKKPMTFVITPYKEDKSREQENMYHALIREIANHYKWEIGGKKRSMADWKTWLTAGFKKSKRESIDFVPAPDGEELVALGLSTSEFKIEDASLFIEYLEMLKGELE